jgi:hypothetical protein
MLLQVIPQAFSAKHSSQIMKPQGQVQQNGTVRSQIVQTYSRILFFLHRADRGVGADLPAQSRYRP